MMQAFRNAAKPLMVVVALTFFAWLVVDLSGITGNTGLLTKTSVGKVNGQSIDARTYQSVVQQSIDARQRQAPGALGLEDYEQIRDEVWEQFVQNSVLEAEYRRRGITVSEDEIVEAMRTSPPPGVSEDPRVPDRQPVRPGQVPALAHVQRGAAVPAVARGAVSRAAAALEAAPRGHRRRLSLRRGALGAVPRRAREGQDRAHRHHRRATSSPIPRSRVSDAEITAYYKAHLDDFQRPADGVPELRGAARGSPTAADTAAARARADSARAGDRWAARRSPRWRGASRRTALSARAGRRPRRVDPRHDGRRRSTPPRSRCRSTRCRSRCSRSSAIHLIEMTSRKGDKAKGRHILIPIEVAGAHRDQLDAQADSLEKLARRARPTPRRSTPSPARSSCRSARPGRSRKAPRSSSATWSCRTPAVWAFQAKPGATSPVIETSLAFYVFRLDSLQAAGVPPLGQIRQASRTRRAPTRRSTQARKVAQDYLKRVEAGSDMAAVADSMKLPLQGVRPLQPDQPAADATRSWWGRPSGSTSGQRSGMLDTKDGIYVMKALEHTKADSAAFVKDLDSYRAQMITAGAAGSGPELPGGAAPERQGRRRPEEGPAAGQPGRRRACSAGRAGRR